MKTPHKAEKKNKLKEFCDYMMTPRPVARLKIERADTIEEAHALAAIKRAEAELLRAERGLPEPTKQNHLHIHTKDLKQLKNLRQEEIIYEDE